MKSPLRAEQNLLIAKKIIMGDLVEFSDKFLAFADKIKLVAEESALNEKYLMTWAIEELTAEVDQDE